MSWYDIVAYPIGGALLLLMSLGIAFSALTPALDRWNRRYLIVLFSLQLLSVVLCFIDALAYGDPNMAMVERVIYIFGFISLAPLMAMPTIFLMHRCQESPKSSIVFKPIVALTIVYFGLAIAAQFTDVFYVVTEESLFERGPLFPLLASPLAIVTILNFIDALIKRKKVLKRYFIASMVYLPPLAVSLIVHMFTFFEFFVLLGLGLWAITLLSLVMQEYMEQHMRQQKEIEHQHASILMLQMRPHFIYNTMTSIYYLCDQDPGKAKQVTLDFTTYLRKNFAAIASSTTVPFADELEHTRAYLAVEQAQFEDVLFVTFDTPDILFRVPPLTLQPIVENAVKHGMNESKDPIHIYVGAKETKIGHEIIVEDDGPGRKEPDSSSPHIALDNIRQRLEMMCGGALDITAKEEGGTRVKIIIPYSSDNESNTISE